MVCARGLLAGDGAAVAWDPRAFACGNCPWSHGVVWQTPWRTRHKMSETRGHLLLLRPAPMKLVAALTAMITMVLVRTGLVEAGHPRRW